MTGANRPDLPPAAGQSPCLSADQSASANAADGNGDGDGDGDGGADTALLARIHAQCFPAHPRPWSQAEITEILQSTGCFLLTRDSGFLIGRSIADEAELLTLAVAPAKWRAGTGTALLAAFHDATRLRGATRAFLEVASDNLAAQALYATAGWREAGRRRNYYAAGIDALILERPLAAP